MTKITYTLEAEQDSWYEIEGSFASGDDEQDQQDAARIKQELNDGSIWAWCVVRVTATCGPFTAFDICCGCNYDSEEDFIKDGLYKEMQDVARAELLEQLKEASEVYQVLLAQEEE